VTFNQDAAGLLRDCAQLLRQQDANPFRVNAYLHAADTLESLEVDARDILQKDGIEGLIKLPTIGRGIAASLAQIAKTGRLPQLDRLRGSTDAEALFQTVPGIGPTLAHKLHEGLHVDTLEALEMAAHDGRLDALKGIGPRRTAAVRAGLAAMLGRATGHRRAAHVVPDASTLLDVDRQYRREAAAKRLPLIAPRRFNPKRTAWLPVMHCEQDDWHFTAMFSNTARAHELNRTNDWVVLYYYDDDHREGQCTVVTETHGPLKGLRVVRGREAECSRRAQRQ